MLIYIIHSQRIDTFKLIDSSSQYILTDYDSLGNKRNLVNAIYNEQGWNIYENNSVKLYVDNYCVESVLLENFKFYKLTILGEETVLLYTMPLFDTNLLPYQVIDNGEIILSNNANADIQFSWVKGDTLKFKVIDKCFYVEKLEKNCNLFLNKNSFDGGYVSNFDTLFINGLKIIFCGTKLFISGPTNSYKVSGSKFTPLVDNLIVNDNKTNVRTYTNFYEEADYYFKSPVFKNEIKPIELIISEPPNKEQKDKTSILITVIPTFLMSFSSVVMLYYTIGRFNRREADEEQLIMELIMAFAVLVGGIIWPFVERNYQNTQAFKNNKKRNKKFEQYLKSKDELLKNAASEQKMILSTNNSSLLECKRIINNKTPELFNRDIENSDFLNIKLGMGRIKLACNIDYKKPDYVSDNDVLLDEIDKLIEENKYIDNAPIIMSLAKKNVVAFILDKREFYSTYMQGILLQLMTLQSYYDLKLVVFTQNKNSELSYLKDSNFCWDNEHLVRYYATNINEAQYISSILEREYNQRIKNNEKVLHQPYYLIVSDSIDHFRSVNIIEDIINSDINLGFGLLMYDMKINNIPNDCTNFVNISSTEGTVFQTNMGQEDATSRFVPEFVVGKDVNVDYCSRMISNIPLKNFSKEQEKLPESIGFLELYNVGNVEQLNIATRWENSTPYNSLAAPVGVDGNGNLINLDLHEKYHGPHGLIAGMTGSGKSEFIITYILSLAINYRPDEVQFVLIDYKGGGLAGAFENRKSNIKLPHLVGTITNLDKAEMKRTLVSINSELQRRQRLFNEAKESLNMGNIDIYKYQKLYRDGSLKKPLSHLFIICDEFAELKAQQPDFMDELVSTARIGRSLGVHLILATQKPSGVVDDQIWSNSKFKVCCKVQTEEDSNEMLKKPEAAYLKEAGRFYLQVGYDEYFVQGQSGYSGLPYIPSTSISVEIDNSIKFIDNLGNEYKTIYERGKQTNKDYGEQLINILNYIIKVSNEKNFGYNQLWLDNVPNILYYEALIKKYNHKPTMYNINPIIGEYDDPKNQTQGYVNVPITEGGNTYIVGASGSGKNNLLSVMIYSTIVTHNSDEVNIYIIDLGAEKLKRFQKAPQVGDVLTIDDSEKIKHLFYKLEDEQNKRQKYYSENGGEFIKDVQNKTCKFPNILVIIYDIEVFKETYEDIFDEKFTSFTRTCSKYGINFIVTSSSTSALGFMAENNFPQKIMLNMIDTTDYMMFFDNPPIPNRNPGRGLIKLDNVYEFQTPLIFPDNTINENLDYVLKQLANFLKNPAPAIAEIPEEMKSNMVINYKTDLKAVPVGIDLETALIDYYDFSSLINLISASSNKIAFSFLNSIIKFLSTYDNVTVIVLNALKETTFVFDDKVKQYTTGFKQIIPVIFNNIKKYKTEKKDNKFVIFALGYTSIESHMNKVKETESTIPSFDDLIIEAKDLDNFKFVLYDTASFMSNISENRIYEMIDFNKGIWIGRGYDSQNVFENDDFISDDIKQNSDSAVIVSRKKLNVIKYIK